MVRAAVIGATGYTGSELVRWLLGHPGVQLVEVQSSSRAGARLDAVIPSLQGFTDLVLSPVGPTDADVVLLAVPHGQAAALLPHYANPRVIDLSADHRHTDGWVYGLVEYAADALAGADRIAVPGCFATALNLAIAPLMGALAGPVHVVAATGSTGSGATPSATTHHPERFADLRAYKVLAHQHVAEVERFLGGLGPAPRVLFVPWSAPLDRGIFATVFAPLADGVSAAARFADAYTDRPLVRLRSVTPQVRHVRGSALADLAVHQDGSTAVVLCALDNLGKGAAAQAVQCLNLAFGLPVDAGLLSIPSTP